MYTKCIAFGAVLSFTTTIAVAQTAYINQLGYHTNDYKILAIEGNNGPVEFVDQSGKVVLTANPGTFNNDQASGKNVALVDFSEIKTAGTYQVKQNGNVLRQDLKIADKAYEDVLKASLKWYYYQRASMELTEQYAGKFKRAAGHPDNNVQFHNSTGKSGTTSSPGGWYDAGDYGKYIVNSGITTYTLLALYEHFPEYFKTLKWNIPASGNLPDLLAEIKYNLDWMLTMQDSDGSVFHKLTTLLHAGDDMPANDNAARYIIGRSAGATLDFAGVMAAAARIYKPFDAAYADKCLQAAKKAYDWGTKNTGVAFTQNPPDVNTGDYPDSHFDDEKLFAATELFVTTGESAYKVSGSSEYVSYWGDMSGEATYEKAIHPTEFNNEGNADLIKTANSFADRIKSGFGIVMTKDDFVWGSNAVASNQGVWLLHAYYMTGDEKYFKAAHAVLDYLLGRNALNMSFVTGFGTKSPQNPHHRPSTADGIQEPIPGMLVGGPQPGQEDVGSETWSCKAYATGQPATTYIDQRCSYATNEVAINWNAPFAYLAGAIEAMAAGHVPSFSKLTPVQPPKDTTTTQMKYPYAIGTSVGMDDSHGRLKFDGHRVFMEYKGKKYEVKGNR
ncbi:MAG: glycoside hydrolase family 9 protein [Fibrobacteraceae bacterium]|nr:glycoside hydrolase family 9 protein [Fibrobacteraceae bacterium]